MAERRGAALPTLTPEQILARYPADVQELAERLRTLVRLRPAHEPAVEKWRASSSTG